MVFLTPLLVFLSKKEANKSAIARVESELCVDWSSELGEWGRWEGFTNE